MHLLQRILKVPLKFGTLIESNTFKFSKPTNIKNTRTFYLLRRKPAGNREQKFKVKDKMPSTAVLVYKQPFAYCIGPLFFIQNCCVIAVAGVGFYTVKAYLNDQLDFPYIYNDSILVRDLKELCVFYGMLTIILFVSRFACKSVVHRIYFDGAENVYKAVLVSLVPFSKKIINIKPKSVAPIMRLFYPKDFRPFEFVVDGRKIFLFEDYFKRPVDFGEMLTEIV